MEQRGGSSVNAFGWVRGTVACSFSFPILSQVLLCTSNAAGVSVSALPAVELSAVKNPAQPVRHIQHSANPVQCHILFNGKTI